LGGGTDFKTLNAIKQGVGRRVESTAKKGSLLLGEQLHRLTCQTGAAGLLWTRGRAGRTKWFAILHLNEGEKQHKISRRKRASPESEGKIDNRLSKKVLKIQTFFQERIMDYPV
jgi:hypothetical protein